MSQEIGVLAATAASIGFLHTLLGPDHYLPFVVMARARRWSLVKTAWITVLCGLGHVGGSVVLGAIGIVTGVALSRLEVLESVRGNLAAWLLIGFGLAYFVWGLRRALRSRSHQHAHSHGDAEAHTHRHTHTRGHLHIHDGEDRPNVTPWILFTIFVLGPCEPLIPILMFPAAKSSLSGLLLVTAIFGGVTVATMLTVVIASTLGINFLPVARMERYTHALAGGAICLCGVSIQFLGL